MSMHNSKNEKDKTNDHIIKQDPHCNFKTTCLHLYYVDLSIKQLGFKTCCYIVLSKIDIFSTKQVQSLCGYLLATEMGLPVIQYTDVVTWPWPANCSVLDMWYFIDTMLIIKLQDNISTCRSVMAVMAHFVPENYKILWPWDLDIWQWCCKLHLLPVNQTQSFHAVCSYFISFSDTHWQIELCWHGDPDQRKKVINIFLQKVKTFCCKVFTAYGTPCTRYYCKVWSS